MHGDPAHDMRVRTAFGARLAELRSHAGLSQHELGARVGKAKETIRDIERGINATPLPEAARIADALGVTLPDLMDLADLPRPDTAHRRAVRELVRTARAADPATITLIRKHLQGLVKLLTTHRDGA